MLAALRPTMLFNSGPTLFLAPSPTSWQVLHFLNTLSPSSAFPCAAAAPALARNATATIAVLHADLIATPHRISVRVYLRRRLHARIEPRGGVRSLLSAER